MTNAINNTAPFFTATPHVGGLWIYRGHKDHYFTPRGAKPTRRELSRLKKADKRWLNRCRRFDRALARLNMARDAMLAGVDPAHQEAAEAAIREWHSFQLGELLHPSRGLR